MPKYRLTYDKRYGYAPATHIHYVDVDGVQKTAYWNHGGDIVEVPMHVVRGVKSKRWQPTGASGCCQSLAWFMEVV